MQSARFKNYIPENVTVHHDGPLTLFPVTRAQFLDTLSTLLTAEDVSLKTIAVRDLPGTEGLFRIMYVFGHHASHSFLVPYFDTKDTFPSLATVRMQCSFYEREIATMFGLTPEGHPDPRPTMATIAYLTGEYPLRKDAVLGAPTEMPDPLSTYPFRGIEGEGIYEIPVGPVHAGIIEPGHFRFSVLGEEIRKLDPMLGWKHKGIEKLFETLPISGKVKLSERVSGDSSFAHSLAFCQALETLSHTTVLAYDAHARVVFAELERIANHFSDIGFMMLDTAFTFGGSNGARLRERVMQWNERLTGSRFLRGVNQVGGVSTTLSRENREALLADLTRLRTDFAEVIAVAEGTLSLRERLVNTGTLPCAIAKDFGVVGIPLRATGSSRDTRKDYPYAVYESLDFSVVTKESGDVYARFLVRVGEVHESLSLIEQALTRMQELSPTKKEVVPHFKKDAQAVSVVEGWRGEIAYLVCTNTMGEIDRVKVRDPSFMNWQAFPETVKGEMVPDFPLVNKSFNLSYSGNDL
jgi:Ni,Fe-hydrogenase III large subunit/Ni,Fe-hydrogenase III component G